MRGYADELLDGEGRERAVIVLGDLNDEPPAATTQILLGPPGSEIGTAVFDSDDRGDAWRLWNLAPLIPEERRFSRRFRGRGELIDHLLVSRALVHRVEQADTGPVEPPSITEDPTDRRRRLEREPHTVRMAQERRRDPRTTRRLLRRRQPKRQRMNPTLSWRFRLPGH